MSIKELSDRSSDCRMPDRMKKMAHEYMWLRSVDDLSVRVCIHIKVARYPHKFVGWSLFQQAAKILFQSWPEPSLPAWFNFPWSYSSPLQFIRYILQYVWRFFRKWWCLCTLLMAFKWHRLKWTCDLLVCQRWKCSILTFSKIIFLRSFSSLPLIYSRRVVVSYKRKYVHELLVNRLFKPAQEKVNWPSRNDHSCWLGT